MTDIHCHILYGADDGSTCFEESVEMAKIASADGTDYIIATPHSNVPGSYQNFWDDTLLGRINKINNALVESECPLRVFPGQEIFCTENVVELLRAGKLRTLNSSRYPLVEFGFYERSASVYEKLQSLVAAGYVPIVAHPERYAFVCEDETAAQKLKNIGCLLQVNKGCIRGKFGTHALKAAKSILKSRLADFVASDAHGPYSRTPHMEAAHEYVAETYGFDYAKLLFSQNPIAVIKNKEIFKF